MENQETGFFQFYASVLYRDRSTAETETQQKAPPEKIRTGTKHRYKTPAA